MPPGPRCPPYVAAAERASGGLLRQSRDQFDEQCRIMPLGRGTSPEEIAAALRFILAAPAMTGQMIALDGGQHLGWAHRAKGADEE